MGNMEIKGKPKMKQMMIQHKQRVEAPLVLKQHNWNTGAKENHQLNQVWPRNRYKKFQPRSSKYIFFFKSVPSKGLNPDPRAYN